MGCMVTGARGGFVPVAMKKGATTYATTASFTDIPGWVADPAFPGSVVTASHELVVVGSKAGAQIVATVPFAGGGYFGGIGCQLRILVNGAQVGSLGTPVASGSGTATCTVTTNLNAGDLVKVQVGAATYSPQPSVTANTPTVVIT